MNKKLLIVAIAGWLTSGVFLKELTRLTKLNEAQEKLIEMQEELIETNEQISTLYEFRDIIDANEWD
jgi:hypothetical protein